MAILEHYLLYSIISPRSGGFARSGDWAKKFEPKPGNLARREQTRSPRRSECKDVHPLPDDQF